MKRPTATQLQQALGKRFEKIEWSDSSGSDCDALLDPSYSVLLYFDAEHWCVERVQSFDDPSVGIFGQIEPLDASCPQRFPEDGFAAALNTFMYVSALAEADARCEAVAEWLHSAEQEAAEREAAIVDMEG